MAEQSDQPPAHPHLSQAVLAQNPPSTGGNFVYTIIGLGALAAIVGGGLLMYNHFSTKLKETQRQAASYESDRQRDVEQLRLMHSNDQAQIERLLVQQAEYQKQVANYHLQTSVSQQSLPLTLFPSVNTNHLEEMVAVSKLVESGLYVPSFAGGGLAALTFTNNGNKSAVIGDTRTISYTRTPLNGLLDTKEELLELASSVNSLLENSVRVPSGSFYTFARDNGLSDQQISKLTAGADMNDLNALASISYSFSQPSPLYQYEDLRSIPTTNNTIQALGSIKSIQHVRGEYLK